MGGGRYCLHLRWQLLWYGQSRQWAYLTVRLYVGCAAVVHLTYFGKFPAWTLTGAYPAAESSSGTGERSSQEHPGAESWRQEVWREEDHNFLTRQNFM